MRIQMLACASMMALMLVSPAAAQTAPAVGSTTTKVIDTAKVTGTITRTRTETGFTEAGSITGPNGNTLTLNGNVARANGTLTANRALTNAAGETVASRNLTATRAANGQVTRTLTTTGPQRLLNRMARPPVRPGRPG